MRPDMPKVITERPRVHGDGGKSRPRKGYKKQIDRIPLDEQPKRESIKRLCGNTKNFTDVLGPLRGYVRKQIGRPWAKVKSEIDAQLKAAGGVSLSHARDHLFDFIDDKLVEHVDDDGNPVFMTSEGYAPYQCEAYVCPQTGLVKKFTNAMRDASRKYYGLRRSIFRYGPPTPAKQEPKKPERGPIRWPSGKYQGSVFHATVDGVWYEYTLANCEVTVTQEKHIWQPERPKTSVFWREKRVYAPVVDQYFGNCPDHYNLRRRKQYYGGDRYAATRRQLNSREIKRLNLNAPAAVLPNVLGGRNDKGKHRRRTRRK